MNIGIVGTNFISRWFCGAARLVDGVTVSAVCSRTLDRARSFADELGIERAYSDYGEMLSDGALDAIYIASPTICHASQAIAAMKCGKHVLCEKMMAASLDEFYEMRRVSNECHLVLLEAMRPAHDPLFYTLKDNLDKIGHVRYARLAFCQYSSRYDSFLSGTVLNAFDPKMKNSAISDLGVYPIFAALALFGEPIDMTSSSVLLDNGFEGAGSLTFKYEDKTVNIIYSKISGTTLPSVIEGECGALTIDKISAPSEVWLNKGGEAKLVGKATVENNMVYEISAFRDMLRGTKDHLPYLELTECSQRIVNAVYEKDGITKYFQ